MLSWRKALLAMVSASFTLLLLAGCHHAGVPAGVDASLLEPEICNTGAGGLKLFLPKGWKPTSANMGVIKFMAQAAQPVMEGTIPFVPTLNVTVVPAGSIDLKGQVATGKSMLQSTFKNYRFVEDSDTTVNGRAAHILGGIMSMGPIKVRNRQLMLVEKGNAYTVSLGGTPKSWPQLDKVFTACLQTVDF